jgi:hypothetical protein
MKSLSAILAFIGLAVLGMLIAGCFVKKSSRLNNVMYCLEIGDQNTNTYVELKDGVTVGEPRLDKKLKEVKDKKGKCEITFLADGGTPDPNHCDKVGVTLKTDRVIKSELASNRGRDSSAANDPNLMNRVSSPDLKDITDIAALLK